MPRQISGFSPSERMHLDEINARHDAAKVKETERPTGHAAEKRHEKRHERHEAAQRVPRPERQPSNANNAKIRRASSGAKDATRSSNGGWLHRSPAKDDKKLHQRSKDAEKQGHVKEKAKEVARHGSGKAPSRMPQTSITPENVTPVLRAAISAQRPKRRSKGSSTPAKASAMSEESRNCKSGSTANEAVSPPGKISRSAASPKKSRSSPPVSEMPSTFIELFSHTTKPPSTEMVVSDMPKEVPPAPPAVVVEPPRALFHINGPLINVNFNLWGK